jgi:hypothetical protein
MLLENRGDGLSENQFRDILSRLKDVYRGLRVSISQSTLVDDALYSFPTGLHWSKEMSA